MKKIIACFITGILLGVGFVEFGLFKDKSIENRLSDIMQSVYAPKTMQEFRAEKEKSADIMEKGVTDRLFVAYGNELTERDRERICQTFIYKGEKENQLDNKERYLVKAYLYENAKAKPIIRNFIFVVGNSGKIEDFTIEEENI